MEENLVIVESPAKAKTIEKILGNKYTVRSSYGHIRDLKKKGLSIDIGKGFEPEYEVSPDKVKIVNELKKIAGEVTTVWLASDEDREGEAIAWHLQQALKLPDAKTKRIVFHEITKNAILEAVEHPRKVDQNLVNAQQARRVLDRLVGFELSPLLWKKIRPSLSAGRVQSVTVRLIVEREREILDFKGGTYYRVVGEFTTDKGEGFKAELDTRFSTEKEAGAFLEDLKNSEFKIESVETKPGKRTPAAPFTTSTLQQEASRKLGFSVSQTMSVAQKLYEAGLITYMRTDSVNLSTLAIGTAKEAIVTNYGEKYHKVRNYTTKSKGAQEAHEAIRPTYIDRREAGSTSQQKRLYDLIWKRTVACQMADAELERTKAQILISNRSEKFVASGEVITFDGFLKLYMESVEDDGGRDNGDGEGLLPQLVKGAMAKRESVTVTQRFTQRPARYSEASLVKQLEELGIGRPSTYAPTISTVINRGYVVKEDRDGIKRDYVVLTLGDRDKEVKRVEKSETTGAEKNKLFPTDIGMMVNDYLTEHFAAILDYNFTAKVEEEFDEIADGKLDWRNMLGAFYGPFHEHIDQAEGEKEYVRSERLLGADPKTGKNVYARVGKFGPMVQLGESAEAGEQPESKPKYASLQKGQMVASITLEEALALFELPRDLGEYEEKSVTVAVGRFGPYIRHDGKFTSLKVKQGDDPYTITLARAIELINEKRDVEKNRIITDFAQEEIQVLNGRYGPYITYNKANYKIPKKLQEKAGELTLEEVQQMIADQQDESGAKKPTAKRGRFVRKK